MPVSTQGPTDISREMPPQVSKTWVSEQNQHRVNTSRHGNVGGESPLGSTPR